VGFLNRRIPGKNAPNRWRIYTVLLGVLVGILLGTIGSIYLQSVDIYLGFPSPASPTFSLQISVFEWYFFGGVLALAIALMGFKLEPDSGRAVLSILVGGMEMVLGYFLYEQLVLGKTAAVVEVAANILQMLVGLAVAIPIARTISRRVPQFKS
jgi:VanZ family protein